MIYKIIGWVVIVLGILDLLWTIPAFAPFSRTLTSFSGKKEFMLALAVPVSLVIIGLYCLNMSKDNAREKDSSA